MNYGEQRAALIEYLKVKTAEADWHGVADAACDLRVMEAVGSAETEPLSAREYMLRAAGAAAVRAMDNRESPIDGPFLQCPMCQDGIRCTRREMHLGRCHCPT